MEMTMAEKRKFLQEIRELTIQGVLKKEDRDDIFRICLVACDRELAKLRED